MDPAAALIAALEAIRDQNRGEALEHLRDLVEWLERGGFLPEVKGPLPSPTWINYTFQIHQPD